jgi:hypothetical protein
MHAAFLLVLRTFSAMLTEAQVQLVEVAQCLMHQVSPMGFGTWAWGNQFLWGAPDGHLSCASHSHVRCSGAWI